MTPCGDQESLATPPPYSPIIEGPNVLNILMSIAKILQAIIFKFTEHTKEGLGYPQLTFCSVVP